MRVGRDGELRDEEGEEGTDGQQDAAHFQLISALCARSVIALSAVENKHS